MSLSMNVDTLPSTCGVGVLYMFEDNGLDWGIPVGDEVWEAGCGWYVAGFIDTALCKEAYANMCEAYTLIYQSPVRRNTNSGRDFFFCIFDAGENKQDDADEEDDV